jgi:preprotein translocase subunit SecD
LHPETNLLMAVIEEYQGQRYILVSNQPEQIMAADGSWGLLAVYPSQDAMGRRAIGLELDEAGAEKFYTLTRNHIDRAMAIVLDGQVLSAPSINSAIRSRAIITGKFTEREIRNMIIALQKGMPAQKPVASSESNP